MVIAAPISSLKLDLSKIYTMSDELKGWIFIILTSTWAPARRSAMAALSPPMPAPMIPTFKVIANLTINGALLTCAGTVSYNKLLRLTDQQRKPCLSKVSAQIERLDINTNLDILHHQVGEKRGQSTLVSHSALVR